MLPATSLLLAFSFACVGLALSDDNEFDWGTEEEPDWASEAPDSDDEGPFASGSNEAFSSDQGQNSGAEQDEPEVDGPIDLPEDESELEEDATSPVPEPISDPNEEHLATMAEARVLCDEVMDVLHEGMPAQAFDRLSTHWGFSSDEMEGLQREVERTRAVVGDRYGDALDYRLVREDTAVEVLVRFVYLERFERHGLRWGFTFYKGDAGWSLNDVYFDDQIESFLD